MVPVHAEDHWLLRMFWKGQVYVDTCLPFGLRSAPKIFSAVADALSWAMHCQGVEHSLHYLDNFLFPRPPGTEVCNTALESGDSIDELYNNSDVEYQEMNGCYDRYCQLALVDT